MAVSWGAGAVASKQGTLLSVVRLLSANNTLIRKDNQQPMMKSAWQSLSGQRASCWALARKCSKWASNEYIICKALHSSPLQIQISVAATGPFVTLSSPFSNRSIEGVCIHWVQAPFRRWWSIPCECSYMIMYTSGYKPILVLFMARGSVAGWPDFKMAAQSNQCISVFTVISSPGSKCYV